jgi:hypothetical protein
MLLVVDAVGHVQVVEPQPELDSNASRSCASQELALFGLEHKVM